MRKLLTGMAVLAAMALGASTASAQVELEVSSSGATVTILTAPLGGPPPASTEILGAGSTSNGWTFVVLGTSNSPSLEPFGLDSDTIEAYCTGGGGCMSAPLVVFVSDVNFSTAPGLFTTLSVLNEPSTGSTSQTAWYNTSNGYFDGGTVIGSAITVSGSVPPAQTGQATLSGSVSGPYSLELKDVFTSGGSTGPSNFFDAAGKIGETPEPRSMLLFGTGLLVFAGLLRRRRRA